MEPQAGAPPWGPGGNMPDEDVRAEVENAFQATFKIIFGECNVRVDELKDYLLRYHYPVEKRRSSVSGKEVATSDSRYCRDAKFIAYDEIDFRKQHPPLGINEIKDIDSIIAAIGDRFAYSGNLTSGSSQFVEGSDAVTDSFYIYNSHHFLASKYAAYSSYVRDASEYVFGSAYFLRSKYLIKAIAADKITRSFETYISANGSDLFFCYDCVGCSHAMFSFNLRTKNYAIGNLELPRDKYFSIRKKLVDESREYLEKNRTFYSMFEDLPPLKAKPAISVRKKPKPAEDMGPIEDAWRGTCRIVLGREIGPLRGYGEFLSERINPVIRVKTAYGNETYSSDIFFYKYLPKERIVNLDEAEEIAKQHLAFEDGEEVTLESVMEKISPVAFFRAEFAEGSNANNIETQIPYTATNTYKVVDATYAKNCAYDTMALNSEYIFGSYRTLYSKFCIRAHSSVGLSNCFDVDCCTNLRDSYFCHNVEGSDSCMFCFNTKSKRFAVGNAEIGRENYAKVKRIVLDEIAQRLESDGKLPFDIFTVACYKP